MKNKMNIAFLMALIGAALMVLSMLLPFASANEDYEETLDKLEDMDYEEDGYEADDMRSMSLVKLYKMLDTLENDDDEVMVRRVLIIIIAVFSAVTLLFALTKKSILSTVFALLSIAVYVFNSMAYFGENVRFGERYYDKGLGNYLYLIAAVVVIVGAVWMKIEKIKLKKIAE